MQATEERQWTYEMYLKVLEVYPFEQEELAKELGVSQENLASRAKSLGVSINKPLTVQEIELYRRYYSKLGQAIIFLCPDRSISEIGNGV